MTNVGANAGLRCGVVRQAGGCRDEDAVVARTGLGYRYAQRFGGQLAGGLHPSGVMVDAHGFFEGGDRLVLQDEGPVDLLAGCFRVLLSQHGAHAGGC